MPEFALKFLLKNFTWLGSVVILVDSKKKKKRDEMEVFTTFKFSYINLKEIIHLQIQGFIEDFMLYNIEYEM